jgi:hypothetical protein
MKKNKHYNQRIVDADKHLKHPEKYIGTNRHNIQIRSGWEYNFLSYLDRNENIIEYSSEEIEIPYYFELDNPPRQRRYFPDFYIKYVNKNDKIVQAIIEIKPYKETQRPVITKNQRQKTKTYLIETYVKNKNKWSAAREFCRKKGWKFFVFTEKDLGLEKKYK